MIQHPVTSSDRIRTRRGATLVEVLMALLVMAIGVTSIFTLFPLSILRSIKASQLTNARLVVENARETVLSNPQFIVGAPTWQPNWQPNPPQPGYGNRPAYSPFGAGATPSDCWVSPTPRPGRLLPETNLIFYTPNQPGTSGPFEPKWANTVFNWTGGNLGGYKNNTSAPVFPSPIQDGSLNDVTSGRAWYPYRHSSYAPDPRWSAYVVDPLGWHEMDAQGISASYRDRLGALDRIHSQLNLAQAQQFFASPDSWHQVLPTSNPVAISFPVAGQVLLSFESQVDITASRTAGRVVLLSEDGRRSMALPINALASSALPQNQIQIVGTLPADFDELKAPDPVANVLGEIASARIDAYEQRFTWMMTVHLGPRGEAQLDCVVFHNRSFNPLDEEPVAAEFHGPSTSFREDQAMVTWPAGRTGGNPPIKEGGYIYDSNNAHWYRIQKIESIDNTSAIRSALLTLNTTVTVMTTTEASPDYDGQAILFPNIVSVFHIDLD